MIGIQMWGLKNCKVEIGRQADKDPRKKAIYKGSLLLFTPQVVFVVCLFVRIILFANV